MIQYCQKTENEIYCDTESKLFLTLCFPLEEIDKYIDIDENIKNGRVHVNLEPGKWGRVKLDDYFPKSLIENKEQYKNYILSESETDNSVQYYWPKNILDIE